MRATLLNDVGCCVNVVLIGEDYVPPDGLTVGPSDGEIGWHFDNGAWIKPVVLEPPPTQEDYENAIKAHLESVARAHGYESEDKLVGYLGSKHPIWSAEARIFVDWRDSVWVHAYEVYTKVGEGKIPTPTIEEFIAGLPKLDW